MNPINVFFMYRQTQDRVTESLSLTLILIFKAFDPRVHASCWLSVSHAGLLEVKTGASRPDPLNSGDHLPDQKTCPASQPEGQAQTILS